MLIPSSLSEFGCVTNKRQFNEIASLYGSDMTSVYSGGLVYEYSKEQQGQDPVQPKYGLVQLNGNSAESQPDFATLKSAFQKTPIPTGDGGYKTSGSPSECPAKSSTWNVTISANQLPAFPKEANDYLKNGCGTGPGLKGTGSQDAGSQSATLAGEADGAVTSGSSASAPSGSKGAAASLRPGEFGMAPLICGAVVLLSSLLGGSLIL
jgi:hypothetical protein